MSKGLPEFHKRVKQTLDSHFSPQLWHIQTGTATLNHSPHSGSPTGNLLWTCARQWLTSSQRFIRLILFLSNLLVSFRLSVSYPPTTEIINSLNLFAKYFFLELFFCVITYLNRKLWQVSFFLFRVCSPSNTLIGGTLSLCDTYIYK